VLNLELQKPQILGADAENADFVKFGMKRHQHWPSCKSSLAGSSFIIAARKPPNAGQR